MFINFLSYQADTIVILVYAIHLISIYAIFVLTYVTSYVFL